jgi:sugar O-acyltransferase (sialic acid O-acetyltransferase NeuD family)
MSFILIGAGGHARVVAETISRLGGRLVAYIDPKPADWLAVPRYESDAEASRAYAEAGLVLGFGAVEPAGLARRLAILNGAWARTRRWPALIHPDASMGSDLVPGDGSQILACARVQPAVRIGRGVIVNTGAIVEHGSDLGDGCHLAPGAVVLGDCRIGSGAMIGSGAVILPGAVVPEGTLVAALTRYPR